MTRPDTILDGIVAALKQSTAFDGGGYATRELDLDSENNRLEQPVVVLKPLSSSRVEAWDSDLIGYTTDDAGTRTGRIYAAAWNMAIEAHILVASGHDSLDARSVGLDFVEALLRYDDQQTGDDLPDGDGGTLDVDHFSIGDGEPDNDIGGVGIRKWRNELEVHFEAFTRKTSDPVITDIVAVDPDSNDDIVIVDGSTDTTDDSASTDDATVSITETFDN